MRSGRHLAQFTVLDGKAMFFGVVRPGWDVEGVACAWAWSEATDGHCFYSTHSRWRFPDSRELADPGYNWKGKRGAREVGDRIGMLLDLDQGSMSVWKDDVKLGVMQSEGLSGPLCWAASLGAGGGMRIESAPLPASPTDEELAAAMAWQEAQPSSDDSDEEGN